MLHLGACFSYSTSIVGRSRGRLGAVMQPGHSPKGAYLAASCTPRRSTSLQTASRRSRALSACFCRRRRRLGRSRGWQSRLRSLPGAGGCHTAAPSPRRCLTGSRAGWSSSSRAERLQEEPGARKRRVRRSRPESDLQGRSRIPQPRGPQITGILPRSRVPW